MEKESVEIVARAAGSRLRVRVKPGAKRCGVEGIQDGALRIAVTEPPEKGRANEAVARLIAEAIGVPPSSVEVVRGHASRSKIVEIAGMAPEELRRRLETAISET